MFRKPVLFVGLVLAAGAFLLAEGPTAITQSRAENRLEETAMSEGKIVKTDEEWKAILTPEQYHVTREANKYSLRALARRYSVFMQAMEIRLKELGLVCKDTCGTV